MASGRTAPVASSTARARLLVTAAAALVFCSLLWLQAGEATATAGLRGSGSSRAGSSVLYDEAKSAALTRLIVVAGHAVTVGNDLRRADKDEAVWYLQPHQRKQGFPGILTSHIREGVRAAHADPRTLLVMSGGHTRVQAGPRSEGVSYYMVADQFGWWGQAEVKSRTVVEEHARDSYENLLFSICRFHEVTGRYPEHVTVVGFDFKQRRFEQLHRAAIKFPADRFSYIGLRPDDEHFDYDRAKFVEQHYSIDEFKQDPYGCNSSILLQKKVDRNPFHYGIPYSLSCPELQGVLAWCGPEIFMGRLPWE